MIGLLFRSVTGPLRMVAAAGGLAVICGLCIYCCRWRARDFPCVKRMMLWFGYDKFPDFELMVLVHEARYMSDRAAQDEKTFVRITAGRQMVETDKAHKGQYQQPLQLFVEQGTDSVCGELLDHSGNVMATVDLDIMNEILCDPSPPSEHPYPMDAKSRSLSEATLILSLVVSKDTDQETGLLSNVHGETNWLVQQQIRKAQEAAPGNSAESEMEVLKLACSGPLEMFELLGKAPQVYLSILGPPLSRKWALGIWHNKGEFESKQRAIREVDLMRVIAVQPDPVRANVFVVQYLNEHRSSHRLMFRRLDRARDVWVELLQILVTKARENRKETRQRTKNLLKQVTP